MTIHPTGQPVTDPFWAAVRRRHPDVDLVLLPPEAAPDDREADELVDAAVLRTDLETVRARAAELGLQEAEERIDLGIAPGAARATTRQVGKDQERRVLDGLAAAATEQGWTLERRPGVLELLVGRLDGLSLRASFATTTGVLVAEVSGPDRVVGTEVARRLAGGAS